MDNTVTTTTKSPWLSKVNWTQFAGALLSLAAAFGLSTTITPEQVTTLVLGIQGVVGVFTIIWSTWFSPQVMTPSATELGKGAK